MANEGVPIQLCAHDTPAAVRTSQTERNPARRFICCRRREFDDCGLWEWIDPELSEHYKLAFWRMKLEKDRVLEQLNTRMLEENLHNERLRMKVSECEALVKKLDKARASIGVLEIEINKKNWQMKMVHFGCVFVALALAFLKL